MKILWVKTDFLHPTTRGGQIRTLEMLRQLHKKHEVHYVAFDDSLSPEGVRRSGVGVLKGLHGGVEIYRDDPGGQRRDQRRQ